MYSSKIKDMGEEGGGKKFTVAKKDFSVKALIVSNSYWCNI